MNIKKKMLICISIILLLVYIFTLTACNNESPCEGEVVKKEFLEAYTTTQITTTTIYNGTTFIVIPITYLVSYPNRWRVTIQWYVDEEFDSKQIYVTEECYNSISVGDWFVYDKTFCTYKEPYTKERVDQ